MIRRRGHGGIPPRFVMPFVMLFVMPFVMPFGAPALARNGDNATPGSHHAAAFESYLFQSPDNGWPDYLTALSQQGYVVTRYKNDTFNDDPEGATISNMVSAGTSGVFGLLHIHGNTTGASVEVYERTNARDDAWDAYIAAGWNQNGVVEIAKSDFDSGPYTFHNIRMQLDGFTNRIKSQADAVDAFIYGGGVCNSWGFVGEMGGRLQFSNDGLPNFWSRNLTEFFELTTGVQGAGEYRPAGEAFAIGSYDETVRVTGDLGTTLSPSVRAHAPTGNVAAGEVAGSVGFDTVLATDAAPGDLLAIDGGATLVEAWWTDPGREIGFIVGDVDDGDAVTVRVLAAAARSAANGTLLDGNLDPPGTDGTAPNGDDFAWTFVGFRDGDGDGIGDSADNCPDQPNANQRPIFFGDRLRVPEPIRLAWGLAERVEYVRGDLAAVSAYDVQANGVIEDASGLDISADVPAASQGFYYIVKYPGACGTWRNIAGTHPDRDAALP